jgi:hypothetical protein
MPDANYSAVFSIKEVTGDGYGGFVNETFSSTRTSSSIRLGVMTYNIGSRADPTIVNLSIFR